MEKTIKLIPGKMNIPYKILKANYAMGVKRPSRRKTIIKGESVFNGIILRKAA